MPAKSAPKDKNKKLTDFFAQKPSVSVPPAATSSTPAAATSSTTRRRPATRASTTAVDRAPPHVRTVSTATTRKRARSPDGNGPSTRPRPAPKPKSPKKPMRVFKPDPYAQRPTAVVYVTSSFRNPPAQQPTLEQVQHTLVTSPSGYSEQIVCSSQSDEAELVLPIIEPRDPGNVAEDIHAWRQKASELPHSSPHGREDAMAVDTLPSSPVHGSHVTSPRSLFSHFDAPVHSAATPGSSTTFHTPVADLACLPSSPDIDELPPLPATPEPMDSEAKTAKLIAEIRARAFAANQSSDDEQPLKYRELEDSDDDDLIGDFPLIGDAKQKSTPSRAVRAPNDMFSSPLSSVPSVFNDSITSYRSCKTTGRSTPLRTSMRTRKPALAFRLPVTIAESPATTSNTKPGSFPPKHEKLKAVNPLHALLREKELEERRGTSCAALRRAEEAIREGSREVSIDDELDIANRANFADEQAAWKAVREFRKSTTPNDSSDEDVTIGDRESKMLGTVAGEAIGKILAGDKTSKGKETTRVTNQKTTFGVSLWTSTSSSDGDMEVDDVSIPSLSGHPILACLEHVVRIGDSAVLDSILRSGTIAAVPKDILLSNIPQLLDMALFASSQVADAVYIAFRDLWQLNHEVQIPFTAILFALVRLGASPSILEGLGWATKHAKKNHVTHETFSEALKRLLAIVKAAGCANAFSQDDMANVVLTLVIMGLDPSTTSELRLQLNVTIDTVCNHGVTDYVLHAIHEKVSSFAKQLVPISKARLVALFASGSNWTRQIARRLAYCLLSAPNALNVQALPLEPLILLLSPDAGSCGLFDVTNESTDYEELKHYVYILSVALVDITPYVEEESIKSASSTSLPGSPNKNKKSQVPPLELLHGVLDALQGKIVDTRAAHLDRSRIKAAIQRLTLRIHYDRLALMDARPRRRTSTLKAYFSPQR